MVDNYYTVLGVEADATQEDIRSAYRRQAKKFHPDHYGKDSGPFRAVQEAYAVLSNPARRQAYDDELARARCWPGQGNSWRHRPGPATQAPVEPLIPTEPAHFQDEGRLFDQAYQAFPFSFEEVFDYPWGGSNPQSRGSKFQNIDVEVSITAGQARRGGHLRILLPAQTTCPACGGAGSQGFFECWHCAGAGTIMTEYPVSITFPAGLSNRDAVKISLDRFGLSNTYLTLHFVVEPDLRA